MVFNRGNCDLRLVSAHDAEEAEAAFHNLSALFAGTPNDVHKVTIPTACGFVLSAIKSSQGKATPSAKIAEPSPLVNFKTGQVLHRTDDGPKNGIHRNAKGEYVQRLADGSEIISESDFSD